MNFDKTKRDTKYLVEIRKTNTRLVNVFAKNANEAKEKAIKAAKCGDVKMTNTTEIFYDAVSKSPGNTFLLRGRKIVDLPSKYMEGVA